MTLKIVLTQKPQRNKKDMSEYTEVPARHLSLFYNIWIKWYLKREPIPDTLEGGFLREIDFEKQEATFVLLRNSMTFTRNFKDYIFLVHNQTINCKSLDYVLELENECKTLKEKIVQLEDNYKEIYDNIDYFNQ